MTIFTAALRSPDDPGYQGTTLGDATWVLEDADGVFYADLVDVADTANALAIEQAVAAVLGVPADTVTATPRGGNISGEADRRNLATTSDEWAVTVRGLRRG